MSQKSVSSRSSKVPAIKIAPPITSLSVLDKPPLPVLVVGTPGAAGAGTACFFRPAPRAGAMRGAGGRIAFVAPKLQELAADAGAANRRIGKIAAVASVRLPRA